MSATLEKLSNGGKGLPCCGLASLALVTNTPLPIIYMHYARKHDKPKQWRGSTNFDKIKELATLYGLTFTTLYRSNGGLKGQTLKNFLLNNPSFYGMIRTDGHIQTVLSSSVYDQSGLVHINEYWGKNKYMVETVEVTHRETLTEAHRCLLLVLDGVCSSMEGAKKLYELYGKADCRVFA